MISLLSWIGLFAVVAASGEYLFRLATARATFSTRTHDALVVAGVVVAAAGAAGGGVVWRAVATGGLALAWFVLTRKELRLGRRTPGIEVGGPVPAFTARTTAGEARTADDLVRAAPALVVFFRGRW